MDYEMMVMNGCLRVIKAEDSGGRGLSHFFRDSRGYFSRD